MYNFEALILSVSIISLLIISFAIAILVNGKIRSTVVGVLIGQLLLIFFVIPVLGHPLQGVMRFWFHLAAVAWFLVANLAIKKLFRLK